MLIDSSAWIRAYQVKSSPHAYFIDQLLEKNEPIFTCALVMQEVLQGFSDTNDFRDAYKAFRLYTFYAIENQKKAAIDAANIYRNCRKKGYTIRKPNDCMIALIALTYDLRLLHNDQDFDHIARLYPLKLVKI